MGRLPEYETAKSRLEAKLKAVRHVVDYYYEVEGLRVSPATYLDERMHLEQAHSQFYINESDLRGKDENIVIKNIAHHLSCDGVRFTKIYDLVSLLNIHNKNEAGYARILMTCANEIRANKFEYEGVGD